MKRRGQDIADRLLALAVDVLELSKTIANDYNGRHIKHQMFRAVTSAGSNYEESRGAESRTDFVHKVGTSLKELRETMYWLLVVREAKLAKADASPLINESDELIAILTASRRTASLNAGIANS